MALYAIGDLHLCLGAPKPMDIFGGAWVGYMDKLKEDVSWFCKKFDYRYDKEPWYDSKDAVERAMKFLRSDLHNPAILKKIKHREEPLV